MQAKKDDLIPYSEAFSWDPSDVPGSLEKGRKYAESRANDAINWYYRNKVWKSRLSRFLRVAAIILTTLAGLIPLLLAAGALSENAFGVKASNLGYILLTIVGALLGLDKYFGFTTSWMRFIRTAASLQKSLDDFKFEWYMLQAGQTNVGGEEAKAMLTRLKQFIANVNDQVQAETELWITDFTNSLVDLDKNTKAQLEAQKPGQVDLTVVNGNKTEGGFSVSIDGAPGVHSTGTRALLQQVVPGTHRLIVAGKIGGKAVEGDTVVTVKGGALETATVTLEGGA